MKQRGRGRAESRGTRLQIYLRDCGFGSRRHCEELIAGGRVQINSRVVHIMGLTVSPGVDRVCVDGRPVTPAPRRPRYILLHKPDGVASASGDRFGRRTVFEPLPAEFSSFFMAGRLDYHTTGLMLLTNDGEFAQMLAHPRFEVEKVYLAKITADPGVEKLAAIERGPVIDGERCLPVAVKRLHASPAGNQWYELRLREGKKNQIRIMFEQIGHPVLKLKRVAIGPFKLGSLAVGEWCEVSPRLVERVKAQILHTVSRSAAATRSLEKQRTGASRRGTAPARTRDRGRLRR